MIKMCVVRRLLVTAILLETTVWLCTAYPNSWGFKCDCPTNDGAKSYYPALNPYSTVNPIYYQLFNAMNPQRHYYNTPQPHGAGVNTRFNPSPSSSSTGKGGSSYHFIYEAENYRKEEFADEDGNIRGHFGYEDYAGLHTLNYSCNDKTGFRITGGNLAPAFPEVLPPLRRRTERPSVKLPSARRPVKEPASDKLDFPISEDSESAVSFSLSTLKLHLENLTEHLNQLFKTFYSAPKDSRTSRPYDISVSSGLLQLEESAYSNGDARGYIQFDDVDGHHNISYFRNQFVGFLVTGGSLAIRSPTYLPPNRGPFGSSAGRINVTVIKDGDDDVTFVSGQ